MLNGRRVGRSVVPWRRIPYEEYLYGLTMKEMGTLLRLSNKAQVGVLNAMAQDATPPLQLWWTDSGDGGIFVKRVNPIPDEVKLTVKQISNGWTRERPVVTSIDTDSVGRQWYVLLGESPYCLGPSTSWQGAGLALRWHLAFGRVIGMAVMSKEEVYGAIDSERAWQDRKWGTIKEHGHEVGAWITLMRSLLLKAETAWAGSDGDREALREIRQVLAVGVACCEQHGVDRRHPHGVMDQVRGAINREA